MRRNLKKLKEGRNSSESAVQDKQNWKNVDSKIFPTFLYGGPTDNIKHQPQQVINYPEGSGVVCKGGDLVENILFKMSLDGVKCIFLLEAFHIRLFSIRTP